MKKILPFLTMCCIANLSNAQCLTSQTVTASPSALCGSGSSAVQVANSQSPGTYYLRDNVSHTVIDGPLAGGSALNFSTGVISTTTTYEIYGELPDTAKALQFDGIDDYVEVSNTTGLNLGTGNFTLEAWVRTNNTGTQCIMGRNNGDFLFLIVDGSTDELWLGIGSDIFTVSSNINNNVWHHVAAVRETGIVRFYVDGVQVGGTFLSAGAAPSTTHFFIGDWDGSLTFPFVGRIDEVRVWNTARSAAQIAAYMDNCLSSKTGLVAMYGMEEGIGTSLSDLAGGNNNGVLTNMAGTAWVTSGHICPGCNGVLPQTVTVTVNPIPDGSYTGLSAAYCEDESTVTLNPVTSGGTFSGPGISGNQFDPASANPGSNTISYSVTVNGCTGNSNQNTTVNTLPDATFTGLNANYCADAAATTLSAVTGGGTFSGTGVTGNQFNPATANIGSNAVNYSVTVNGCTSATIQNTNVIAVPDAAFSGLVTAYCEDQTPVTLTPVTAGGSFTGPGITGNQFDPSAANIGSNTIQYTVTVNGCTGTSSQATTVNALPDASFTGLSLNYCVDDMDALLTPATAGGIFTGTGISGSIFSPSLAGPGSYSINYSVTVAGCSSSSLQNSSVHDLPVISLVATDILCNGDNNGSIDATSSGSGTLTYDWAHISGTSNPEDVTSLAAGTFNCTVTDANGCSASAGATINEPVALSVVTDNIVNPSGCGLSDGSIQITASGGTTSGTYTYSWGDGAGYSSSSEDISGLPSGTYTVTIEDDNNCQAQTIATLSDPNGPTVVLNSNSITSLLCNGDSDGDINIDITLNGGAISAVYQWSSGESTEDISGLTAGNYDVTVTDNNNCTATLNVTISEPTAINIVGNITHVLCNGDNNGSVDIAVTGGVVSSGYSYSWSDGFGFMATTEDISALNAGSYTLIVSDDNNCSLTEDYIVNQPDLITGITVPTDISCNGLTDGSINLNPSGGDGNYSYLWNDASGSTTQNISGLPQGMYTVVITDGNGCTGSAQATISEPMLLSVAGNITHETSGNDGAVDITVNGGMAPYTFSWSGPGAFSAATEDITGIVGGTYTVTITDANGCTVTENVIVTSSVDILENPSDLFKVYPNPANGEAFLVSYINTNYFIKDLTGKTVLEGNLKIGENSLFLNTLSNGLYLLIIHTPANPIQLDLMIQK
jgi:hypothetical protein